MYTLSVLSSNLDRRTIAVATIYLLNRFSSFVKIQTTPNVMINRPYDRSYLTFVVLIDAAATAHLTLILSFNFKDSSVPHT